MACGCSECRGEKCSCGGRDEGIPTLALRAANAPEPRFGPGRVALPPRIAVGAIPQPQPRIIGAIAPPLANRLLVAQPIPEGRLRFVFAPNVVHVLFAPLPDALPYRPAGGPGEEPPIIADDESGLDLPVPVSEVTWCCVSKPTLNETGDFQCQELTGSPQGKVQVRHYYRDSEGGLGDDVDPARTGGRNDEVLDETQAGRKNGGKRVLYEAYCTVTYFAQGLCSCTVQQELELGERDPATETEEEFNALQQIMLAALTRGYNAETLRLANDPKATRLNDKWDPSQGVKTGHTYKDYIQSWTKCCQERKANGHYTAILAFVDAPGNFGDKAKGAIKFTITFTSNPYAPGPCKSIRKCVIEFELKIGGGVVEIMNKQCYCIDDAGNSHPEEEC